MHHSHQACGAVKRVAAQISSPLFVRQVVEIGKYVANQWLSIRVDADAGRGQFAVTVDGKTVLRDAAFPESASDLQRISFRTGPFRGVGGSKPVPPESDRPTDAAEYLIRNVRVSADREVPR